MSMGTTELDPRFVVALEALTRPGIAGLKRMVSRAGRNLVPNPRMGNREWIEANLWIPNGSRPGPFRLDPTQAEICDLLDDPDVDHVVWLKPPRSGSSTMTAGLLIKRAAHDASNTVFYERNDDEAQNFHDKKLRPILDASTSLAHLIRPDTRSGVQDSWSDIYLTNGASLQQRGVMSNGNFKAINGELIALDEGGDKAFKVSGKDAEGSKVGQAETRSAEFAEPKMYIGGTPTTPDCMVVEEYEKGDKREMRMRFPCCGRVQPFLPVVSEAGTRDEVPGAGLKFRCENVTYEDGEVAREVVEIGYECANPKCRKWLPEDKRNDVMETRTYVPTKRPSRKGYRSVYTWAIHSKDPAHRWPKIVAKYLAQRANPDERQDYVNLWLALPYTPENSGVLDPHKLALRCEPYAAPCPEQVVRIYGAWDTQRGSIARGQLPRHEGLFWGVGPGREIFILGKFVVDGTNVEVVDHETGEVTIHREQIEPFGPEAWRQVLDISTRAWRKPDGTTLTPSKVAVDIGYDLNRALQACSLRESRRAKMVPVKGKKEARGMRAPAIARTVSKSRRDGLDFVNVGTQSIKDTIHRMWGIRVGEPESIHAPLSLKEDNAFWDQITAERLFEEAGKTWWDKEKPDASNENLDLLVYLYAAMCLDLASSQRSRAALAADVTLNGTREPYQPHEGPDHSVGAEAQRRTRRPQPAQPAPPSGGGGDVKRSKADEIWDSLPVEMREALKDLARPPRAGAPAQAAAPVPVAAPEPAANAARGARAPRRTARPNRFLTW